MTRKLSPDAVEEQWWRHHDEQEPLMGVPSVAGSPAPLPDTASYEPEPGLAMEQEAPVPDDDESFQADEAALER